MTMTLPVVQPFRVSNDALGEADELRRRLAEEGYIFIRGLVDPELLAELRLQLLAVAMSGVM
jgi:hypothetical protein